MAEAAAKQGYGEDAAQPGVDSREAQNVVDTARFAAKAASGGLMEVMLGELAQQKGQSAAVKQFGQTMVTDHGKANAELKSLAQSKKIALPTAPLPMHQQHIDHLKTLSGAQFDQAYMSMMVKDHQKDIGEFKQATMANQEPAEVKAFAQKTLPVLQRHLALAGKTLATVQKTPAKTQ
jgi:putative membrane protein